MVQINKNTYLLFTVFVSGMTTLGVELSASRLLDPFFGNSIIIWANLIGLVLIYLSLGYWVGGRWADADSRGATLFQIIAWGAFLVGLIPLVAAPILRLSARGFATFNAGILIGSLLGVLILFSLPMTLLAMTSPFAIRLAVGDVNESGKVAGSIYALSTLGSIFGTFLPVLILVPNIGTRRTFLTFAVILMLTAIIGLFQYSRKKGVLYLALLLLLLTITFFVSAGPIKANPYAIYESESRYNYIQVTQEGDDILLYLNEGEGIHSVYNPTLTLVGGIWDYFLIAPYFNPAPYTQDKVDSLLLIGAAAGTIPKQFTAIYGPIPIDGVEIDPGISEAGRRFFAMTEPNLRTINQGGRYFLNNASQTYDVIAVDAYRPPYIPFQLTTEEFFQEIYDHLNEDGVMAINAGRTHTDYSLVLALAAGMKAVFPKVYVIDAPDFGGDLGNSLIVATKQPTRLEDFFANAALLDNQFLQEMAAKTFETRLWQITCQPDAPFMPGVGDLPATLPAACPPPFTDDKAPVEQVVHGLVLRYLLGE
ncbi:MAG TPA: spermine synthase [Anaerolineae bacterium]|nr:spermine synthase [Anaerolineae bacterium]